MNGRARSACVALVFSGLLTGCDGCDESTGAVGGGGGEGGSTGGSPPQGGTPSDGGGGGNDVGGQGGEGGRPPEANVTITVIGEPGGVPLEGVTVIASNEDASLADEATTAANGIAAVFQPAGGSVSVLRFHQAGYFDSGELVALPMNETRTFYLPSDTAALEVHVALDLLDPPAVSPMSLSFDVEAVAGAVQYALSLSCGYREVVEVGQGFLDGYEACGGQPFDALLIAQDADGIVIDYAFQTDVPFQAGADVVLALPFGEPFTPLALEATFVAAEEGQLASYGVRPGGLVDPLFFSRVEVEPPASPLTLEILQPSSYATRWCALGSISRSNGDLFTEVACDSEPLSQITLDENALGTVSGSLGKASIELAVAANGPLGDGVQILAFGVSATDESCQWSAFRLPGAAATFSFPELPAGRAAFVPSELDYAQIQHVRFSGDIGGDFIGHVASMPSQDVMFIGAGYVSSTLMLGL